MITINKILALCSMLTLILPNIWSQQNLPFKKAPSETFDVGMDKGSSVALEYHDKIPFKFNGTIEKINIKYIE